MTGLETTRFTEDVWQGVAESYARSAYNLADDTEVTSRYWYDMPATSVANGFGEYRLGSVITMHSKFIVCNFTPHIMHFNFHANADSFETDYALETAGVTEASIRFDFQTRVTNLLTELGIAERIGVCIDVKPS
ncbi:hypothetical protein BH09PAT3_BH09PAT3_3340 [soil metagenome]